MCAFFAYRLTTPPSQFTGEKTLEVKKGMTIGSIAKEAADEHIVRSSFVLRMLLSHHYNSGSIYAGLYRFDAPVSAFAVAKKLASSDIDKTLLSITIPEGSTNTDIAAIITAKLNAFNIDGFLALAKDKEGYLFPDTYLVRTDFTPQEFVDLLTDTYAEKISPLKSAMASSSFSEYEVLTLASIIEREGKDETSMRTVAGILENRLSKHMPLQADAAIEYVLNKSLAELTPEDLEIDSPYNTYKHLGLPPTPIGNPGLQSIKAVLDPIKSDYLYYLTDKDGVFHYAKSFEEHKRNIAKYLKK